MFEISKNGIITVNRGDDFTINTMINIGTELEPIYYTLREHDLLYFAIMEPNRPFEHAIVRKMYTYEDQDEETLNVVMNFVPEDTEFLVPGNYYYMVKLRRYESGESGEEKYLVDTIINKRKFILVD